VAQRLTKEVVGREPNGQRVEQPSSRTEWRDVSVRVFLVLQAERPRLRDPPPLSKTENENLSDSTWGFQKQRSPFGSNLTTSRPRIATSASSPRRSTEMNRTRNHSPVDKTK
jgi:hypothetical protein